MSVLSELFGNCPQLKIIETFAENYNDKLYAADIARMTDVNKATVHSHINKLLDEGLIEKKEKFGNTQLYQLNLNNSKAKMLLMLESYIISERLENLDVEEIAISNLTIPELTASKFATSSTVYRESFSSIDKYKKKGISSILELLGLNNHTSNPDIKVILKNSKVTHYG